MRQQRAVWRWTTGSLAIGAVLALVVSMSAQAQAGEGLRSVRGEVVAVGLNDSPQTIVVKTMTPKKEELIVGAVVTASTEVTRGKNKVGLDAIKVGEAVDLSYVKQADGLVAKAIRAK